jgi:hypothetical protein
MKATLEIPDDLYRRVKAKSALEGCAVREVAIALFQNWVEPSDRAPLVGIPISEKAHPPPPPPWFGSLRKYAPHAQGRYDLAAIRKSIARGRAEKDPSP